MKVPLRQLILLLLVKQRAVTIPEVRDRFGILYSDASKQIHSLSAADIVRVCGYRPHVGRSPVCRVYAPTALAFAALVIPHDTPLVWPPPAEVERPRRGGQAPERELVGPADPPIAHRRPRSSAGSGQLAAPITIGRGSKWFVKAPW